MSDKDIGVGRQQMPTTAPMSETEGVGQVTGQQVSSPPPVDAPTSPPADLGTTLSGPTLSPPIKMNPADLMALLFSLQKKTSESRIETVEVRIKGRAIDQDIQNADAMEKLKKINSNKSDVGNIFSKIFAWIGVALTYVIAGIVGVISGGAAAAPLIALAVVATTVLILQQSGLMDKMMDAMGMDDKAKMAFSIALTVVMLVANIVATVATGGLSGIASIASSVTKTLTGFLSSAGEVAAEGAADAIEMSTMGAEAAEKLAETVADTVAETVADVTAEASNVAKAAEDAAEVAEGLADVAKGAAKSAKMLRIANKLKSIVQIISGVTMVIGGSVAIDTANKEYKSITARADLMRDKAALARLMALNEEDTRRIRQMIEQLQQASSMIIDTLSAADETATKIRTSV